MHQRTLPQGPFTTATANELGVTHNELSRLVAAGALRQVLHNGYVDASVPDTLDTRAHAAALVMLPHRVLCDRTAAWLHGIDVLDLAELELLPSLDMWVMTGHARVRRREARGGERDLKPEDIMSVDGVRVTTPLRTCMDLGSKLSRRNALACMDAFMRLHRISRGDLGTALPRFSGRRGVVQLRDLIRLADPRAESSGESWTRLAIIDAGLPAPVPQVWVTFGGRKLFRLDLAYAKAKVAVEYDGEEFHTSPERRRADQMRRKWLRDHGWTVIVVRKSDFTPERLDVWLGQLRDALRAY
jgi:hypothetical protein